MIRIALSGASGRMGQALQKLIDQDAGLSLVATLSKEQSLDSWSAGNVDAVIDFSLPEAFEQVFEWCLNTKTPLISGTTGMKNLDFYVEKAQGQFPFMYSGNYSLGVAGLIKAISSFKALGPKSRIWIEDYHHINKLDAPSGTALKIQSKIKKDFPENEAPINSARAGSIFGVHHVHIATDQEWVTLSHQALNRDVFAQGALNAASWLVKKEVGFYELEDFLNDITGV